MRSRPLILLGLCRAIPLAGSLALAVPRAEAAPQGGPGAAAPIPVDSRDDRVQRKAIRGGPLDLSRESPELRELRSFEQASFPRAGVPLEPGQGPGGGVEVRGSELLRGLGPDALPEGLHTPLPRRGGDSTAEPTTIPWLSALKLLDNLGLSPTFVRFEAHVIKYLEFYKDDKRGRSIMASWLRKQGRYKELIEQVLDKHKLPRFLLYVAMIESGYDPHDRSNKGAVGLWQFMPEGARIYGLRVDYWVDERKDPVRATEAVARYLGDLKARFGSWHLSLAAFNAGYGAVLRAIQKYNTNDYWELCRHEDGLPWETLLYVPKAIATALVGENRGFFGYEELLAEPPLQFDTVPVRQSVSLAAVAKAIGSSPEELQRYNPELRRGRTPPPGTATNTESGAGDGWLLRLPLGTAETFRKSTEVHGEKLEPHVLRFGERLDDLARSRGVSIYALRRINGVDESAPGELRAGVTVLLPPASRDKSGAGGSAGPGASDAPLTDEITIVAVPDKRQVVPGKKRVFYRVIPGDTVWAIARFFKVKEADLLRWNNIDPEATLTTRLVLDLWVDKDFDETQVVLVDPARVRVVTTGSDEFFELVETLRGRRRIAHVCKAGDTMDKVAKKYNLTVADLERINRLGRTSELKPGQPLTVYLPMSTSERAAALKHLLPGAAQDGAGGKVEPAAEVPALYGPPAPTGLDSAKDKEKAKEGGGPKDGPKDGPRNGAEKSARPDAPGREPAPAPAPAPAGGEGSGEEAERPLPPPPPSVLDSLNAPADAADDAAGPGEKPSSSEQPGQTES